jgi:hypothetical protein
MSDNPELELLRSLQYENQDLRDLLVSLSATLLRHIALNPPAYRRNANNADAERLVEDAEQCFRCAKLPGLKKEVAEGLEAAGHQLMARAVEIETIFEREKWKK